MNLTERYIEYLWCPTCHKHQKGELLENGLIKLPCGVTMSAKRRWHEVKPGVKVAYGVQSCQ